MEFKTQATSGQIAEARKLLELKWNQEGACASCGWHALLGEHDVEDLDIVEAIDGDGVLKLKCLSKNDEDQWNHRSIKICIRPNA
jgi:hypothetical protein